ncbi:DNA-3-methyladenine glycosylase [Clostridium sp. LIBA-8841]|uniref:DNA-3-methyladenine glycosylase n=1 Tax=Clostridium sp. LIBA-8841 TaxID=2987530 RepID=UPI002AC4ED38|nr:DNA-3-methyladenine glycosylase [Clostridium sp. LIBA-8841]MDZ5254765.1 DNA-3-methyladenine glycosylase [Clostridium sp. LIBA-8841]
MRLNKEFFNRDTLIVAKELLGKILVRKIDGVILKGKIVETEAYIGAIDKASHAYGGRRTNRTETLYEEPGTSYVYSIYGMYYCLNLISEEKDVAAGVLIRGIEPLEGIEEMSKLRYKKTYEELSNYEKKNFSNGPSKLCMALGIDKRDNCINTISSEELYVEEDSSNKEVFSIVESKRIGIDYAEEAKDFLWRFYIKDNKFISKK